MKMNDYTNHSKNPEQWFWKHVAVLLTLPLLMALPARNAIGQEVYVPVSDSLALVAFYNSMSGEHWINNGGWLVDRVDTWFGITTENVGTEEEPEWRVVEIELNNNMTMPGSIPPELGDLEYLSDLVLRGDPALFGPWPDEIGKLQNIFEIRTQDTNMSGEIPWEKFAETPIRRIRLQEAQHRGVIPDGVFSQMPQLQRIEISNQFLSGNFPSSVVDLVNLRRFRLQGNLLTGTIPDMGHIEDVEQFHVNGNPLDPGPVWPWLESWAESLEELRIDNSNRTGEVPFWLANNMFALEELTIGEISWDLEDAIGGIFPDMSSLLELDELHVYGPHWEGSLPEWIGAKSMNRVFFFYCSFAGDIPASYANTRQEFRIEHCPDVTGGIPETFELYTGRDFVLDMSDSWDNKYDRLGEEAAAFFRDTKLQIGDIPTYMGNWSAREITLKNVGATGPIPTQLMNNQGLQTLNLSNNPGLTGDLPSGLFDLSLSLFDISNTGLNVTEFPAGILEWELSLNSLGMGGLGMSGSIPATIGNFPLLQNLNLSDNNLTGSIPEEIGNLPLVVTLSLANNQLSGDLPSSLKDVGYLGGFYTLNALDLSGNEDLTGEIPDRFAQANRMRVLRYNDTDIWAPDNSAFAEWMENVIPGNTGLSFPALYVDVQTSGLVGGPTSAEDLDMPYIFHLSGNYPNPFNPTTSFTYQIPVDGNVTLSIYNVLGQRVALLVNEVQSAGEYQITFNASQLASGTYLYRLKTNDQTITRSMMLIK